MDLLRNILAHFKYRKNTQNAATFNEIVVKTVTKTKTSNENSQNINSNPENEANDISNPKLMDNCENSTKNSTTNAEFAEANVASNSFNIPTNINKESTKNNSTDNIQEIQKKTFSHDLQFHTNNELPKNTNLDENTMRYIEEFDTILGNLPSIHEPICLDEFEELFQEHDYLLNIDSEESIPVHVINKNDCVYNHMAQTDNKPDIEDDTDVKVEKIGFETNIGLDSTKLDANTRVPSMHIDDVKTKTDGSKEIKSNDFQNISTNAVSDNLQLNNQKTPSIEFVTDTKVDNPKEVRVTKFDNDIQVDNGFKSTLKQVDNEVELDTYELKNDNTINRSTTHKADNNNLEVDNNKKTIIQEHNNIRQIVYSNINISNGDTETNLTNVSNLIEITLTKIHNDSCKTQNEQNDVEENLEIISITSDEINLDVISINSDETEESDCGYHSSDFEFISEDEAKLDGFIINYRPKGSLEENQNKLRPKTLENSRKNLHDKITDVNQPGPSDLNANNNYESYRNRYARPVVIDRTYRDGHEIPEGERFMDLFRGMFNPAFTSMVENKSIRTNSMLVEFEGIGFERQLIGRRRDSSEDEHEHEAEVTAKKIQEMYPGENRRKRRRF